MLSLRVRVPSTVILVGQDAAKLQHRLHPISNMPRPIASRPGPRVTGAEKVLRREIDASAHKALLDELAAEI